ncbi:hypothetical protein [Mycolicibacterium rhodesiae]|uniref:Polyketide cyclase / dehydrase and lipid transport n=1 Tax=Mycolicibacterium rhodesiae TaxID=36814 RepID=A0A1X0IZI8_MYCRH|nr:hypothetical protein [Mycolicibacterium rhodesiae]MCV7345158.1 hypothetical protein [Mycolicibacterium rhodesiae]ORB54797.1 hypothetical protein BST42_08330 [Mycolicibacterium rhodesiae]
MERLPYIDEHAITVPADRAATWRAVLRTMCSNPDDPETVPLGFTLEAAEQNERFAITGRHPFSVYRLIFLLDDDPAGGTRVAAQTWAAFPGFTGRIYRALVIGSGGHRVVVGNMLKRIARQALSATAAQR